MITDARESTAAHVQLKAMIADSPRHDDARALRQLVANHRHDSGISGAVLQRVAFADTAAATAWLAGRLPTYNANASRTVRLQPYIDGFRDHIALWAQYPSDINEAAADELSDELEKLNTMAVTLEQIEAEVNGGIAAEQAKSLTPAMTTAKTFTAPASWLRRYANDGQRARMTAIYAIYDAETTGRDAYVARLTAILAGVTGANMDDLKNVKPADHRAAVREQIRAAKAASPIALHDAALDLEVTNLKAAVEAAALAAVNQKFITLNATLDRVAAMHTEGSDVAARLATLRAFHAAHSNAVLDMRDVDAKQAEADTLATDARAFVNAQFAEIANYIDPIRQIIDVAMAGVPAVVAHPIEMAAILAFTNTHDDAVEDTRDYRPYLTRADQLNTAAIAWANAEFGGVNAPLVTVVDFEAAAAPGVGRKNRFKSLIRQGTITPGAVARRFSCAQDVVGGYTYSFSITNAPNTVVHAHYLADDSLGGAHFKPGGGREGELGHGINQLTASQIADFVTTPKQAYEAGNGAMPAHLRRA